MADVVVIGAGVIGLSCALVLAQKGAKVRILATHFPSDPLDPNYTSPWAGAHFRPFPSSNAQEAREAKLTRVTQRHFRRVSAEEPESSIRFVQGVEYLESPNKLYSECLPGYAEDMQGFRRVESSELPPGADIGFQYETWVLNAPLYLQYLERKLRMKFGVKFERSQLESLQQAAEKYPGSVIVNATGRGLQFTGGYDPKCYVIRGQTLLVRAPPNCPYLAKTVTHQSKEGLWTFVIPRPLDGGVILGGTKQPYDTYSLPRQKDTEDLRSRGRKLYPELLIDGEFDILRVNVGFRPARRGGLRVERETYGETVVIHAYGAGGMGYELSYGVAMEVLEMYKGKLGKEKL